MDQSGVGNFALWVGIGASLGLWRVVRSAAQRGSGNGTDHWINTGLFVLLLALVGARLSFVLQNPEYFRSHPLESLMIWLGGLTWPGALAGGGLGIGILTIQNRSPRSGKLSPGWISDALYPLLPVLAVTTWLGCWAAGVGYGATAPEGAWWAIPAAGEDGQILMRWPVQPLAALTLLAFFALLEWRIQPMRPPGRISRIAITGLLLHLLIFSAFVADPAPHWNGFRADTWIALAGLLACLIYFTCITLLTRLKRHTRSPMARERAS